MFRQSLNLTAFMRKRKHVEANCAASDDVMLPDDL